MTPAQRKQAQKQRTAQSMKNQLQRGAFRGAGIKSPRGGAGQTPSEIQAVRIDPVKTQTPAQTPAQGSAQTDLMLPILAFLIFS